MEKRKYFWILLCFLQFFPFLLQAQDRRNPFLAEWDDAVQKVKPGEAYTLRVKFHVPSGHYLYADKTEVNLSKTGEFKEIKREVPKPQKHFDPFLKQETDAYLQDFEIKIVLKASPKAPLGRSDIEGEVKYQGCSSDFCYRPMRTPLLLPMDLVKELPPPPPKAAESRGSESLPNSIHPKPPSAPSPASVAPKKKAGFWDHAKRGQIDEVLGGNLWLVLALAFIGGLLTCFTPCVLPIVPLTLAVVGIKKERSFLHNIGLSLALVLGMSLTYAILGLASALLGLKLGFLFQSQAFLVFLILFFVLMAGSLWGLFQIELPLRWRNFFANLGGGGHQGAFLAGLSIGFIASPCVGPLIGPILLWVAKNQKIGEGMLILFAYGLGMGSLFILMGAFYSTLAGKIRGGHYSNVLKKALALLMLAPALYYGYVIYQQHRAPMERQGWAHSLEEGFARAQTEQKPVLIDFYADWCLPCLEIDHKTFGNAQVQAALRDYVPIKINCTSETPACKEAVSRYEVVGWPTLLFLDPHLALQKDLSVVGGFVGPERMLEILAELKNRGKP